LKVGGALDGTQLADAQHRARYRALKTDWIGHKRPDVRVGLQDQGHALDSGSVSTLATLDETLLEQRLWIGELRDALASGALAAEVVREALAIRGLREHAREGEFANAARASEEQGVGYTIRAKRAAQRGDNAFVAEKFGETHALELLARGS
jgi:hypothetical protein